MRAVAKNITNLIARGNFTGKATLDELEDTIDYSSVDEDSVVYSKPMKWRVHFYNGGEFKITNAANQTELENAVSYARKIAHELGLDIAEMELLSCTVNGELESMGVTTETLTDRLENSSAVTSISTEKTAPGDIDFRVNEWRVILLLEPQKFVVGNVELESVSNADKRKQEVEDKLNEILSP